MSVKQLFPGSLSKRNYHLLRGLYFSIFTIICAVMPLAVQDKADAAIGWLLGSVMTAFFAAFTTYHFIKAKKSNPEAVVYVIPTAGPPDYQLHWYKRMFWMGLVAFSLLTGFTAWGLYSLETGAQQQVPVLEPIALAYENLGFIPAVVIIPLFGVLCLTVFFFKIRALQRNTASQ